MRTQLCFGRPWVWVKIKINCHNITSLYEWKVVDSGVTNSKIAREGTTCRKSKCCAKEMYSSNRNLFGMQQPFFQCLEKGPDDTYSLRKRGVNKSVS